MIFGAVFGSFASVLPYVQANMKQFSLTKKEEEIVLLLLRGLNDAEIANCLGNSPKTIKHHFTSSIFKKTKVNTKVQLFAKIMGFRED